MSILPKNVNEAKTLLEKAQEAQANMIEVRFDKIEDLTEIACLTKIVQIPLIATNRKSIMGTNEAQRTLLIAAKNGFEYVDMDINNPNLKENVKEIRTLGTKPIISFHNYYGTVSSNELEIILEQEIQSGAEICKIVTTAKTYQDNLDLLNFIQKANGKAKIICFAMGEKGKISRLLSPTFGAYLTYASVEGETETAPGQMTIQDMKAAYRVLGIK